MSIKYCEYENCGAPQTTGVHDNMDFCPKHLTQARATLNMAPIEIPEQTNTLGNLVALTPIDPEKLPRKGRIYKWPEADELMKNLVAYPHRWFRVAIDQLFDEPRYRRESHEETVPDDVRVAFRSDVSKLRQRCKKSPFSEEGKFEMRYRAAELHLSVSFSPFKEENL